MISLIKKKKKKQFKTFAELPSLYVFLCLAPPFATHTHAHRHAPNVFEAGLCSGGAACAEQKCWKTGEIIHMLWLHTWAPGAGQDLQASGR